MSNLRLLPVSRTPRLLPAALGLVLLATACAERDPGLEGIAVLPADTFRPGPISGQFIEASNGRTPPFRKGQPVQGVSALLIEERRGDRLTLLALSDNGYGSRENSADFVLTAYRMKPEFRTADGGSGEVTWEWAFELHDPDRRIPFPLMCEQEFYPESYGTIPVDERIRRKRLLTGADFDPESFRRARDGTFWIGDEFGPWLLHVDAIGRVLEAPVALPGVKSPQSHILGEDLPTARASGGFEALAQSESGDVLYAVMEKPLLGERGWVGIYAFAVDARDWLHEDPKRPSYRYRPDEGSVGVTDVTRRTGTRFLVTERDDGEGPTAMLKRVYEVDLARVDGDGFLEKRLVLDLLDIPDPHDLGGDGSGRFTFPFVTTEALAVLDEHTLLIVNDNNYPFSVGRHAETTREPDDTEIVLVRLP